MFQVEIGKNKFQIQQDISCHAELADYISKIINCVLIDEVIKESPAKRELPIKEQIAIVNEERKKVLLLLDKSPFMEEQYLKSKDSSIIPLPCEKCKELSCSSCKNMEDNL